MSIELKLPKPADKTQDENVKNKQQYSAPICSLQTNDVQNKQEGTDQKMQNEMLPHSDIAPKHANKQSDTISNKCPKKSEKQSKAPKKQTKATKKQVKQSTMIMAENAEKDMRIAKRLGVSMTVATSPMKKLSMEMRVMKTFIMQHNTGRKLSRRSILRTIDEGMNGAKWQSSNLTKVLKTMVHEGKLINSAKQREWFQAVVVDC